MLDISEYIVSFSFKTLLKFMFYHLLWFFTGLLVVPFVIKLDSLALAKNMSFWFGTKNVTHLYVQLF